MIQKSGTKTIKKRKYKSCVLLEAGGATDVSVSGVPAGTTPGNITKHAITKNILLLVSRLCGVQKGRAVNR